MSEPPAAMTLKRWTKLSEAVLFKNPWWTYKKDSCLLPSGRNGEYHYVYSNGSSLVIPLMSDGTILLVNQYRYLVGRESLEFPCGSVKEGSSHDDAAACELTEETGYSAGRLVRVGEFNPYNWVTNEMCCVYAASGLRHVGDHPDETEEFESIVLTPGQIDERIDGGIIWDGMTIAAWAIAWRKIRGMISGG